VKCISWNNKEGIILCWEYCSIQHPSCQLLLVLHAVLWIVFVVGIILCWEYCSIQHPSCQLLLVLHAVLWIVFVVLIRICRFCYRHCIVLRFLIQLSFVSIMISSHSWILWSVWGIQRTPCQLLLVLHAVLWTAFVVLIRICRFCYRHFIVLWFLIQLNFISIMISSHSWILWSVCCM